MEGRGLRGRLEPLHTPCLHVCHITFGLNFCILQCVEPQCWCINLGLRQDTADYPSIAIKETIESKTIGSNYVVSDASCKEDSLLHMLPRASSSLLAGDFFKNDTGFLT